MKYETSAEPVPVVCGIIRNPYGRLLISKRKPEAPLGGKWEFPGGRVEPGESLEQAMARELQEELGVVVTVGAVYHRQLVRLPHGFFDLHYMLCDLPADQNPQAIECAEWRCVWPSELKDFDLTPGDEVPARLLAEYTNRDEPRKAKGR